MTLQSFLMIFCLLIGCQAEELTINFFFLIQSGAHV